MNFSATMQGLGNLCLHSNLRLLFNKQSILQLMRISVSVFFIIISGIHLLWASPVKAQSIATEKVTIGLSNGRIEDALKKIEKQTSLRFYYRNSDIKRITNLHLSSETRTLEKTLVQMFENTFLTFRQIDNAILIEKVTQQSYQVKGRVVSANNKSVDSAKVVLKESNTNKIVQSIITDANGLFFFQIEKKGSYFIEVSKSGNDNLSISFDLLDIQTMDLGNLFLDPVSTTLNEVVITSTKPFLKREIDRLVVDIANSVYSRGENAMRLFNVIPGVQTDAFGNILYRGSEAVTVYVDNIKVQLSGQQLANYLRSIPSESIKSYEIRSIGGAQFDADNSGTVINIVLKNDYKYGLNGSVGAEYQYTKYSNTSIYTNMDYSIGKFTFQVNGSIYSGRQFEDQQETQFYKSSEIYSNQLNNTISDVFYGNYKVGLDYRMTKDQTFTVNFEKTTFPADQLTTSNNKFSIGSPPFYIDSAVNTSNKKDILQNTSQANFLYRNKLDTLGSRLDIGYSYIDYDNKYDSEIASSFTYPERVERNFSNDLFISNPLAIRIHTLYADLEKKLPNSLILNLGAKYNTSDTDNDITYFSGIGGDALIDISRSNRYKYDERILAFYGSFAKDWNKWGLKIGMRVENTNYHGSSVTTSENVSFDRWSLFPSVFLQNKINDLNSLTLSYSRSINRPSYKLLNSFENIQNPFYIETGNPFLLPFFTHKTELSYLLNSKYNFTFGYNRTTNGINNVYSNEGPVIYSSYANVNDSDNMFFSTGVPVKLLKWWEINTMLTLRYTKLEVDVPNFFRVKEKFSQDIWFSNRFRFENGFFAEVSARYGRNQFLGIYDWKPQGNIDLNFKKSLLNDKLTMTLNLSDPFNLRKIGWRVDELEFTRDVNYSLPSRFVSVGVSYNISKGKKKVNRENINRQDEDERSRLNN
jgi:hypothetical protein